jgi:hypothetical protein
MSDEDLILSRTEVLELLSQKAREGSTSAMIALERALRIGEAEAPRTDDVDFIEQLTQSGWERDEAPREGTVARREARSLRPLGSSAQRKPKNHSVDSVG